MCRVAVAEGEGLLRYSFPPPHPFNSARATRFWEALDKKHRGETKIEPERADEESLLLFQTKEHVEFVRKASTLGYGALDDGDTPAFKGILEAAEYAVGSTLACVGQVLEGATDHGFNPVGGLHHARRNASAGFCVFNDIGISIEWLRKNGVQRILYVDIDAHHGDGVFYPYENDPDVFIFDVHQDGRFLYPGTGSSSETGKGKARGTKLNIPILPGAGDEMIGDILRKLEEFTTQSAPEFILLQAGADSLGGDLLGGLAFTKKFHGKVAKSLHEFAHDACRGRIVALGGGGYDVGNCADAWTEVVASMRER